MMLVPPLPDNGVFYASATHALTGPVVDHTDVFPDLASSSYQDNADQAIHQFIT